MNGSVAAKEVIGVSSPKKVSPPEHARKTLVLRAVFVWVAISSLLTVSLIVALRLYEKGLRGKLEAEANYGITLQAQTVCTAMRAGLEDVRFVLRLSSLSGYIENPSSETLKKLQGDCRAFSENRGVYDKIRLIDAAGMEMVRVNLNTDGTAAIVSGDRLQSKAGRYFVREAFDLKPGQVYLSPYDLNVEQGLLETPHKPTIRFGAPVVDAAGVKKGLVLLNGLGEKLLFRSLFDQRGQSGGRRMLVNSEGYWLESGDPKQEWGFLLRGRKEVNFAMQHPEAWARMTAVEKGCFSDRRGLFVFTTILPSAASPDFVPSVGYPWKLIYYLPQSRWQAIRQPIVWSLAGIAVAGSAIVGFVCFLTAFWVYERGRRRQALMLAERVAVNSADNLFVLDVDKMRFVMVSEKVCADLEYSQKDLLAMMPQAILDGYSAEVLRGLFGEILSDPSGIKTLKVGFCRKDGHVDGRQVDFCAMRLEKCRWLVINATSSANRKEFEANARKQEIYFQNLIDVVPNPIFYKDLDGIYLGGNRAFEVLMRLSRQEGRGDKLEHLLA
ncbi:MAG: hypothetical protein WCG06_01425, partial [Candidatus Omnitrophota bacterium]